MLGFSFALLTLIIPRYVDYLPEYIYLFNKNNNIKKNDTTIYNNELNHNDKRIIISNQHNECYKCKKTLDNNFIT